MVALRRRLAAEDGFTLLELQIVFMIMAILILCLAPAYKGSQDRAAQQAAVANVHTGTVAAALYYTDYGTYVGMTPAALQDYSPGLPQLAFSGLTSSAFCMSASLS